MRNTKRWILWSFCLVFVVLFSGCPQKNQQPLTVPGGIKKADLSQLKSMPGKTLLRWLPVKTDLVMTVPDMEQLSFQLSAFLNELQKFNPTAAAQLRGYIEGLQSVLPYNPLDRKTLFKRGLKTKGALVVARAKVGRSKVALMAVDLKFPKEFEKYIQAMGRQRFQVQSFRTSSLQGIKIVGAYRSTTGGQQIEEMTYAIEGKQMLLVLPLSARGAVTPRANNKLTPGERVLVSLLRQSRNKMLAFDKTFRKAVAQVKDKAMLTLFRDQREQAAKARPAKLKLTNKAQLSQGLTAAKMAMQRVQWMSLSATSGFKGVQLRAFFRTPSKLIQPFGALLKTTANTTTLHSTLHSDNIALMTLPLKPQNLEGLLTRFGVSMKQVRGRLKKLTGVELDSLLSHVSGEAVVALNDVDSKLVSRWSRYLMVLPAYLGYTVAARTKDPKALAPKLEKIAKTLKIFGRSVKRNVTSSGRVEYSIELWPGTTALWTLKDNLFLYSLGKSRAGMDKMMSSLKHRYHRVFRKGRDSVLANSSNLGLRLELKPFRKTFLKMDLPFAVKLAAGNFLTLLQGVDALEASLQPKQDGLRADVTLLLERFKKPSPPKDNLDKKAPQPPAARQKDKAQKVPARSKPRQPAARPAPRPVEIKKHPSNKPR